MRLKINKQIQNIAFSLSAELRFYLLPCSLKYIFKVSACIPEDNKQLYNLCHFHFVVKYLLKILSGRIIWRSSYCVPFPPSSEMFSVIKYIYFHLSLNSELAISFLNIQNESYELNRYITI